MTDLKKLRVLVTLAALAALISTSPATAQRFDLGADFVSRYVWRGTDFGESFSVQPSLEFSSGPFAVGSWASYSMTTSGSFANEHDLYASVSFGPFSVAVTDYYFPAPPFDPFSGAESEVLGFSDYDGDGNGAHWIEPSVSFSGPESLPINLLAGVFVHNDPDNSVYLEASYPFRVDGVDLAVAAGFVPMTSGFYGTDGAAFVNLALAASRDVAITDAFSIPASVTYVINPEADRTYLVFGVSF